MSIYFLLSFICEYFHKRSMSQWHCPTGLWSGALQVGIRVLFGVAWSDLGGWGCYNVVSERYLE
jgi:hypothetical protein